jgi:hypothetical protein
MNLWLSEYIPPNFFSDKILLGELDVLVHNGALTRYKVKANRKCISHLSFLSEEELLKYGEEKISWNKSCVNHLQNELRHICLGDEGNNISPVYSSVIERLFFHCSQGCLDALIFSLSAFNDIEQKHSHINIIIGQRYRLTEIIGLIWWISVVKSILKDACDISYVVVSRNKKSKKFKCINEMFEYFFTGQNVFPSLSGGFPTNYKDSDCNVTLMWCGALRFPDGWGNIVDSTSYNNILRVVEKGSRKRYKSPAIELMSGDELTFNEAQHLYSTAIELISAVADKSLEADKLINKSYLASLERYFIDAVYPLVLGKIGGTVKLLDVKFSELNVHQLYSSTAPFIESIALHQWALNKNILPILLPHSWTSSHEWSPDTYIKSLTFVNSKQLMPSALEDTLILKKEFLVSLSEIENENSKNDLNLVQKNYAKLVFRLRRTGMISINYIVFFLKNYLKVREDTRLNSLRYNKKIADKALKVGFILNWEHYEFTAGLDFQNYFKYIHDMAVKFSTIGANIFIRRKIGWTNIDIFKKSASNLYRKEKIDNIVISPDDISLEQFAINCDFVLYFQGTSALPEIMSKGVPIINLRGKDSPVKIEDDYIVIPENISPRLTAEEIIENISNNSQWLNKLAETQKKWTFSQMKQSL